MYGIPSSFMCSFHLFCTFSVKLDWREATLFATYLVERSKWSRTIYTYQKAVIMMMINPNEMSKSEFDTIEQLMR